VRSFPRASNCDKASITATICAAAFFCMGSIS